MSGRGENLCDNITLLDVVDESVGVPHQGDSVGDEVSPPVTQTGLGGSAEAPSGIRARPKKLVPARRLGLMNREEVR